MTGASPSPPDEIRLVIADDHAVVRAGLRSLLNHQEDMTVIAEAEDASSLRAAIALHSPDVVVTDLRMPGAGIVEMVKDVTERWPNTHVVVFSAFDEPADALDLLDAGATGYVLKQASEVDLLTAIRRASQGRRFIDASLAARVIEVSPLLQPPETAADTLSARESQVLDLVAQGYTGPQIAAELGVRIGTVETLRHRIRKKLGLETRADFMAYARSSRFRGPRRS